MNRLKLIFYVLSIAAILSAVNYLYPRRIGYGPIERLVPGLSITHRQRIVHGIDISYIYELDENDSSKIDLVKRKLKVLDLPVDGGKQPGTVLLESERPSWWPERWPATTKKFGYVNLAEERYALFAGCSE